MDEGGKVDVALAYFRAWTSGDINLAMSHVADDVVCDPAGPVTGKNAFRPFMAGFAQMVTSADLIAAFGDADRVALFYEPHTTLVPTAPAGELLTVRDGKIVHSLLIFDQTPFTEARRAAQAS